MKKLFSFLSLLGILVLSFPDKALSQTAPNDSVYNFVTKMPEYPGGQKGMLTYFIKSMRYPLAAYTNGVSGTAYVNFIVETDGSISDVLILKPVGYGCDEEAKRLVSQMKGWTPGEMDGKRVRVRSNTPIYFKEELYPDSRIYIELDTVPKYPGGIETFLRYVQEEKKLPDSAKNNNIDGEVKVNFVIEKDGTVSNVMILNSLGYGCDEEATRIITNMTDWRPGYIDEQPVRALLSYNIVFVSAYSVVEKMPEFPGGFNALFKYLAMNIRYPPLALNSGIQGRVFINFVVESDGSISNVRLLRGIGGGCDSEALRVVRKMPKWIPGVQKGKPVRVSYNLPVKFTMQ